MSPIPGQEGRPLALSAAVTLNSGSAQRAPVLALKNPTGEHCEIREIHVTLSATGATLTGATVGMKLDLGNEALTNGYVPVWLFGRRVDATIDQDRFVWRLKYPLYVPAGGVLVPEFQHRSMVKQAITARITYLGRVLPVGARPSKVHLPWVAYWASPVFLDAEEGTASSSETELTNPHGTAIELERLAGRINRFYAQSNQHFAATDEAFNVSLRSSRGEMFVGRASLDGASNALPFSQVFGYETNSWEQRGTIMEPGTFYTATLEKVLPIVTGDINTVQGFIGMVSWRKAMLVGGQQA